MDAFIRKKFKKTESIARIARTRGIVATRTSLFVSSHPRTLVARIIEASATFSLTNQRRLVFDTYRNVLSRAQLPNNEIVDELFISAASWKRWNRSPLTIQIWKYIEYL